MRHRQPGAKIRRTEVEKVPCALVPGGKKAGAKAVAARSRAKGDEGVMPFAAGIEKLRHEAAAHARPGKRKA
ncbi:MAG: His/Gly/Thr/Pro-type tRNA ligase C-terminal domain-containing protein [Opitutaceae bacterium]